MPGLIDAQVRRTLVRSTATQAITGGRVGGAAGGGTGPSRGGRMRA
jgi:hypothetical protein